MPNKLAKWNKYCIYFESYTLILLTFGFYPGKITETEIFSFIANLKINFFYSTLRNFRKFNHPNGSLYSMVYLSVGCGELCLQIRLSVFWLGVMFGIGFDCLLVGGMFGIGFVCLLVGGYVIT